MKLGGWGEAVAAAVGLAACSHGAAPVGPSAKLVDTAAHTVRLVTVAPGVHLEVLDFGGTGKPMVMLAGFGHTAHVFDELAPLWTDRFHVYAVTRRGFGASSWPESGYDLATRVADDVAVLDAIGAPRAVLVGHSIAGGELTELAATHGDRVAALVYLDAVSDPAAVAQLLAKLPDDVDPPPPPQAMASLDAFSPWLDRTSGVRFPPGDQLAIIDVGPDGKVRNLRHVEGAQAKYAFGTVHRDLARVHAPSLVFIASPTGPEEMFPRYHELAPKTQAALQDWWRIAKPLMDATRADVQAHLQGARIVEIPHANHYLFLSNRDQVVTEMREFLRSVD